MTGDARQPACPGGADVEPAPAVAEFGEDAYLEAFADVAAAIAAGSLPSAAVHFHQFGREEGRLDRPGYAQALGGPGTSPDDGTFSVDAALVSNSGAVFLVGWIDDRGNPLRSLSLIMAGAGSNSRAFGRCRRPDVDSLLGAPPGYCFGFWLAFRHEFELPPGGDATVRARRMDGRFSERPVQARRVGDAALRETILGHVAALEYFGNRDVESFANFGAGAGRFLAEFSRGVSAAIAAAAHVQHYGPGRARFQASLIVCLFGKVEYFFLQNALFGAGAGVADYEFIYVSNSPELTETLQREARVAERIYGLSLTLVTLPDNAGFGAANNAAARAARSERLVFVNPDVFPRDRNWAQTHAAILAGFPREHTLLFGAPLYYDDGSLMHGGMYFEVDRGMSVRPGAVSAQAMVRVEHYGKGAPAWSDKYTRSRPVPAVTGAFISADRAWFEALGGFTEEYVFGHYEDADLCLKSLSRGVPAWLHDIRFWHLEGKGSVRRPPHEGGALVNRWLFTQRWAALIERELSGRAPSHPLLQAAAGDAFSSAEPAGEPLDAADPGPQRPVDRPARRPARTGRSLQPRHG